MASIAAGNAGVTVQVHGQRLGSYGGVAPQARVAVYKACWTAPDPADDGCSTADLVTAIDAAVRDRVDVLNLSVGGPDHASTPSSARCSARPRPTSWWSRPPATTAPRVRRPPRPLGHHRRRHHRRRTPRGACGSPRAPSTGAMASTRGTGPARVVLGAGSPRPGHLARPGAVLPARQPRRRARRRAPSCSASAAASDASTSPPPSRGRRRRAWCWSTRAAAGRRRLPQRADRAPRPARGTRRCVRWLRAHPGGRAALRPDRGARAPGAARSRWTRRRRPDRRGRSSPTWSPPAVGVLGAVPPSVPRHPLGLRLRHLGGRGAHQRRGRRCCARRHDWPAGVVRSALATTAGPVPGAPALPVGAGRVRVARADRPASGLPGRPAATTAPGWTGRPRRRSTRPRCCSPGAGTIARGPSPTSAGGRCTSPRAATGFTRHEVAVRPAAIRLAPGESATVHASSPSSGRRCSPGRRLRDLARRQRHPRADPGADQPLGPSRTGD